MTILFKNDWLKYKNAIIDYKTSNKSALDFAGKLRLMGVENNAFILALHNPALQGLDPYSPDLTKEQQTLIAIEAKTNPWYFLREIAKAPSQSGIGNRSIEINRSNVALWWCFLNHLTIFLMMPRQTGKSFNSDIIDTWLMGIRCTNTKINLMTKDETLRIENITRLKNIYEELPVYLKFKSRLDTNNTERLTVKALNNTYTAHVPATSEKGAINKGRGISTAIFKIDEGPFQKYFHIAFGAAMGSMGAIIEEAKIKGEPYGIVITSTAFKRDTPEGKYVNKYIEESTLFTEKIYDCENELELEKVVRSNSRGKRPTFKVFAKFSYKQLGKDDKWLMEQLERTNATPESANMDYLNICDSGNVSHPLNNDILNAINNSIIPYEFVEVFKTGGYVLRWYIPENQIKQYMDTHKTVFSLDPSDAGGGDDIGLTLIDVTTGGVIAAGNYNKLNIYTFTEWLISLLIRYKNSTMIIERRSSGASIIDIMLEALPMRGVDPFERLFNWVSNSPLEYPELAEELRLPINRRSSNFYIRSKNLFGFATSGSGRSSRNSLYSDILQISTKQCGMYIRDDTLANQIIGLEIRNGRIDHAVDGHDDMLISFLLAHWFLRMGKNLNSYGINSNEVLSEVNKKALKEMSEEDYHSELLQRNIRRRIEEIHALMINEDNEYIINRYENEVRKLDKSLILKENENFSMDSFMASVKEKQNKVTNRNYSNTYSQHNRYNTAIDIATLPKNTRLI